MPWRHLLLIVLALPLFTANAQAEDKEPTAVIELGPAGGWGRPGASSYGPSLAVEFTPIKDWLEIEAGGGPMFHGRRTEWDTDLLFKKPFTLSDKLEFMVGIWTAMDVLAGRDADRRGVRARLHVLARRGSKIRLVFGASL
jgi:hypothetical protein